MRKDNICIKLCINKIVNACFLLIKTLRIDILTILMSKETLLRELPNASNIQMNMSHEQVPGQQMPPQPNMVQMAGNQIPQPNMGQMTGNQMAGNQMYQDNKLDQEGQTINDNDNFMKRQFVSQPQLGPPHGNYNNQYQDLSGNFNNQKPGQPNRYDNSDLLMDTDFVNTSILNLLMSQSKKLAIIFCLLFAVQLETTQSVLRKVTRMVKVPDSMVFMASKILSSLVGVIAFFFVTRSL